MELKLKRILEARKNLICSSWKTCLRRCRIIIKSIRLSFWNRFWIRVMPEVVPEVSQRRTYYKVFPRIRLLIGMMSNRLISSAVMLIYSWMRISLRTIAEKRKRSSELQVELKTWISIASTLSILQVLRINQQPKRWKTLERLSTIPRPTIQI